MAIARENERNAEFKNAVCRAVNCQEAVLIGCIPRWVDRNVASSLLFISEEYAQELAEKYPNIIHFYI